jgi:propanediol dehydratase small subunit
LSSGLNPAQDYPLAQKRPDLIRTATGKGLGDLTLDNVLNNRITPQDVTITPEALLL